MSTMFWGGLHSLPGSLVVLWLTWASFSQQNRHHEDGVPRCRMEDGRIPKDMLYSELCLGTRPTGRPALRFKDVCKRDMKACDIDTSSWETAAHNRTTWRKITHDGMKKNDKKRHHKWQEKRNKPPSQPPADPALKCNNCSKVCGSRIGLPSHRIRCIQKWLY